MDDYKNVYSKINLFRAWKWINTNPSAKYKNYFRDSYSAYAISIDDNINDLYNRLKNNSYMPEKPSKVLLPKSICTTRLYTLLTVQDQIVYQAFINVIAEKYKKKAKNRYCNIVFGNLYAGKRSIYFYRKWNIIYSKFNKSIKKAYSNGYEYIAFFDLTACYDSIDHKVLGTFLKKYGLDVDFINKLLELLKNWSTNNNLYKGHGIPQGPISSGILSEIMLSYFDKSYENLNKSKEIKYFRYVDDIKLLAESELPLIRMLARLDYICKQVGLFPQSSKIDVHKIINIDEEIKNISSIDNEILKFNINGDYKSIRKELLQLLKKDNVKDVTKFKMYLYKVKPNAKVSNTILNVLHNNPQLFESLCNYFKNYTTNISSKIVDRLILEFKKTEIYQIINAKLIEAIQYNLSDLDKQKLTKFIKERWSQRNRNKLNPMYRKVIISYLLKNNLMKYKEIKEILISEKDWWVKKSIVKYIDLSFIGEPSYIELNKVILEDICSDVSLSAAHEIIKNNCKIKFSYNNINYIAQKALKFAGLINRSSSRPSLINKLLSFICGKKLSYINWKKVFRNHHDKAENMIIRAQGYVQNDMSAFVNILDTFNDFLLNRLYMHDSELGKYNLGSIGSVIFNKNTKLEKKYPKLFAMCKKIHDKRLECDLSHSITKKTKKYTRPIQYKYIYEVKKNLYVGYEEVIKKW